MAAMRIAAVSDIHGNLPALEAVVRDFTRRGVDAVVNLGDHLSGPLLPAETATYLMAQDWTQLAGNHERQLLEDSGTLGASDEYARARLSSEARSWIATLRPAQRFDDDVYLCHGTPSSDLVYLLESVDTEGARLATEDEVASRAGELSASLVLCGHSHVPRAVRTVRGQLLVNPGSVGLQAYDWDVPLPHVVSNGSPDARYAILERGADGWTASLISVPYDYRPMAKLARDNGRPDWEIALLTGRMP